MQNPGASRRTELRRKGIAAAFQQVVYNQIVVCKMGNDRIGRNFETGGGTIGDERHLLPLILSME